MINLGEKVLLVCYFSLLKEDKHGKHCFYKFHINYNLNIASEFVDTV